jgi:hypothetical protein
MFKSAALAIVMVVARIVPVAIQRMIDLSFILIFPSKGFDNEEHAQCLEICTLSCSKMGHFAAQHN